MAELVRAIQQFVMIGFDDALIVGPLGFVHLGFRGGRGD